MDFFIETKLEQRKPADVLAIPYWEDKKSAEIAVKIKRLEKIVEGPIKTGDFKGKRGEVVFLYGNENETRIALVGLGQKDKCSMEYIRRAFGSFGTACQKKKITKMNILLPEEGIPLDELVRGITEGLALVNYSFQKLKGQSEEDKDPFLPLEKVSFYGKLEQKHLALAKKYAAICEGVYLARDLVNDNADTVNPQYLGQVAQNLAKKHKLKVTIFDKKRIEKEKMGLLLAVNRGSDREPVLIILEYKGNARSKDHTIVIGKGVTYDTGGLNIKPTGSMETMKDDMAGAAVCLGLAVAASRIGLKENFTIVIPSTENSVDAKSYKPGDVYQSYSGKTVEIGNTDAEGRLILADAISYAVKKLQPSRIIDLATLTGSIDVALGAEASGMMSNDDELAATLISASKATSERVWRMPLYEEYRDQLKSDIADIKNVGSRSGGACTAAKFLEEFIEKIPWAHLDIASTAFLSKGREYLPKYATGVGVRLLIEFFEQKLLKGHEKS